MVFCLAGWFSLGFGLLVCFRGGGFEVCWFGLVLLVVGFVCFLVRAFDT